MARPAQDPVIRFAKFFAPVASGCHEFRSTIQKDGYGRFHFKGRQAPAHRVAYQLYVGEIPAGMMVCHKCDNRCCVNPEHFFLGDAKDNVRDMHAKGRAVTRRTVSDVQVKKTLALRSQGLSQARIAEELGMDQANVSRVLRNTPKYMKTFT